MNIVPVLDYMVTGQRYNLRVMYMIVSSKLGLCLVSDVLREIVATGKVEIINGKYIKTGDI